MAAPVELPWRAGKGGVVVRVRVMPKSLRDGVDGIEATAEGAAFKVRVRAVPEDGAANAAVAALLADWLGVAKRSVALVSGAKARVKSFAIAGEAAVLEAALSSKYSIFMRNKDD